MGINHISRAVFQMPRLILQSQAALRNLQQLPLQAADPRVQLRLGRGCIVYLALECCNAGLRTMSMVAQPGLMPQAHKMTGVHLRGILFGCVSETPLASPSPECPESLRT